LLSRGSIRENDKEPNIGPFGIYIEMFFELNTCRAGMGDGPISFTTIHNFANIKEIKDFDEFHYIMRQLDNCYLKNRESKDGDSNKNN